MSPLQAASVPQKAAAAFPLHVEPGKRYLVDARGQPFLLKGDAPWCLITQLTRPDLDRYLDDRRRKGFNALLVELTESYLCAHAPDDPYGEPPFEVAGDFTRPNERYFAHAEDVIARAEEKGFLVLLTPAYLGYDGGKEGWYRQMTLLGEAKMYAYGRYVARRFGSRRNILWLQGGDFNPPEKALVRAVANGIRDVDATQLQTFHAVRQTAAFEFFPPPEPWLSVNDIYTNNFTVVPHAFTEYARSTAPFFLIEARYENEFGAGEHVVRMQAYQALLSGASGHVMGNRPVWGFFPGWKQALDDGGALTLTYAHALFDSLAWWELQPDVRNRFLTAGAGSGDRAVAAVSSDGSFAIAYTPSMRFLHFELRALRGPQVSVQWYDPTSGTYANVPGSPFAVADAATFTPPGPNSRGFDDWVLVFRSLPAP